MSDPYEIAVRTSEVFRAMARAFYNDQAVRGVIPAAQAPMLTDMAVVTFQAEVIKSLKAKPLEPTLPDPPTPAQQKPAE